MGKILIIIFTFTSTVFSQVFVDEPVSKYQNDDYGFTIGITQQGMGIGGFYNKNISDHTYIGLHAAAYKMRDKYEYQYVDYYYPSYNYNFNRYNNLYFFPVTLELKRHFLVEKFQNDIRPAIFLQAGTTFGMNFPQKEDMLTFQGRTIDDNRKNEYDFGLNVGLGASLDIATSKKVYFALKPVYNWIYFASPIASEKWHSAFEIGLIIGMKK